MKATNFATKEKVEILSFCVILSCVPAAIVRKSDNSIMLIETSQLIIDEEGAESCRKCGRKCIVETSKGRYGGIAKRIKCNNCFSDYDCDYHASDKYDYNCDNFSCRECRKNFNN